MLKRLLILLILTIAFTGCTKQVEHDEQVMNNTINSKEGSSLHSDTDKEIHQTNDLGNRDELLRSWKEQYEGYIEKIDKGESSYYDYVMASDRANGLMLLSLEDSIQDEQLTLKQEELKQELIESPILNGYTSKGIHFVAIVQPVTISVTDLYKDAIHTVRGDNQEIELFDTLDSFSYKSETGYFAIDLFVEDLLGNSKQHSLNVTIQDDNSEYFPLESPYYEGELDYLVSTYHRAAPFNKNVMDRDWQLFLFETSMNQPKVIVDYDGELIELSH